MSTATSGSFFQTEPPCSTPVSVTFEYTPGSASDSSHATLAGPKLTMAATFKMGTQKGLHSDTEITAPHAQCFFFSETEATTLQCKDIFESFQGGFGQIAEVCLTPYHTQASMKVHEQISQGHMLFIVLHS